MGDLDPGMKTAVVRRSTVADSLELTGIAVRREQLVCPSGGAALVGDGRRVPSGMPVAESREETVLAPSSAMFCADFDGLEGLSPDALKDLTVPALKALMETEPVKPAGAAGRLVMGYDWYFAALAPAGGELNGEEYSLRFEGMDRRVSARLLTQSEEAEGQVALLFRLTQGGRECLSLRKTRAALVLSEITGLEVPEEAVIPGEDGREFVYTLTAGELRETAVEILYTVGGRSIAAVSREAGGLREGMTVVIKG